MDLAWWSVHHHLCCLCVILGSASFILSFHVQHHLHDVQHYSCCPCMMFSIIHVVLAGCSVQHYSCCPCRMFSSALFMLSLQDVQFSIILLVFAWCSASFSLSLHDTQFSTILFVSAWSDVQFSIFNLSLQDIQFSITYHHDEQEPVSQAEVVMAPTRCNSLKEPVRGELTAKAAGVYTLVFDNSYSRWAVWPVCCCAHSCRLSWPAVSRLCWSASTYKGGN